MVTYANTKRLLRQPIEKLSVEKLRQRWVKLNDAYRFLTERHLVKDALQRGFLVLVFHNGSICKNPLVKIDKAIETTPKDAWLSHNLLFAMQKIQEQIRLHYQKARIARKLAKASKRGVLYE